MLVREAQDATGMRRFEPRMLLRMPVVYVSQYMTHIAHITYACAEEEKNCLTTFVWFMI